MHIWLQCLSVLWCWLPVRKIFCIRNLCWLHILVFQCFYINGSYDFYVLCDLSYLACSRLCPPTNLIGIFMVLLEFWCILILVVILLHSFWFILILNRIQSIKRYLYCRNLSWKEEIFQIWSKNVELWRRSWSREMFWFRFLKLKFLEMHACWSYIILVHCCFWNYRTSGKRHRNMYFLNVNLLYFHL